MSSTYDNGWVNITAGSEFACEDHVAGFPFEATPSQETTSAVSLPNPPTAPIPAFGDPEPFTPNASGSEEKPQEHANVPFPLINHGSTAPANGPKHPAYVSALMPPGPPFASSTRGFMPQAYVAPPLPTFGAPPYVPIPQPPPVWSLGGPSISSIPPTSTLDDFDFEKFLSSEPTPGPVSPVYSFVPIPGSAIPPIAPPPPPPTTISKASNANSAGNTALQDYEMQVARVEGQKKKRLLMAERAQKSAPADESSSLNAKTPDTERFDQEAPQSNHALQDYQMQLMLLEQQKKKRLLLERKEQADAEANAFLESKPTAMGDAARSESTFQSHGSTRQNHDLGLKMLEQQSNNQLRTARKDHARNDYELQLKLLEQQNQKRFAEMKYEDKAPALIKTDGDARSAVAATTDGRLGLLAADKQTLINHERAARRFQDEPAATAERTLPQAKDTKSRTNTVLQSKGATHDAKSGNDIARIVEGMPQHIDLLYHILCSDKSHTHHHHTFRDRPVLKSIESSRNLNLHQQLSGTIDVTDLNVYLDDAEDDMCAVVVRTTQCPSAHNSGNARNHGSDPPLPALPAFSYCGYDSYRNDYSDDESDSPEVKKGPDGIDWKESLHFKTHFREKVIKHATECHFEITELEAKHEGRNARRRARRDNRRIDEPHLIKNQLHPAELWLYHNRHNLELLKWEHRKDGDYKTKAHIQGLLEYIELQYGKDFAEADTLMGNGMINRKHALKLFRPNDRVFTEYLGQPTFFMQQEWPGLTSNWHRPKPRSDDSTSIDLTCWLYQSDGSEYTRCITTLTCDGITAKPIEIKKLTVYPCKYVANGTFNRLAERGRKVWELEERTPITYTGWDVGKIRYYSNARFIVDQDGGKTDPFDNYRNSFDDFGFRPPPLPLSIVQSYKPHSYDDMPVRLDTKETPKDDVLSLIAPYFMALALDENKWRMLSIDGVHPAQQSKNALEQLVLPDVTKGVIKTLVAIYTPKEGTSTKSGITTTEYQEDIVSNEHGNALLMLLHGPPGTGKTFAAHAIAEEAGAPLYRIPCVDKIEPNSNSFDHSPSRSPTSVEKCIQDAIKFGQKLKCVLLLDNADYYLGRHNIQRDKTTPSSSAILNMLQKYKGVVILTTNRLEAFDDSFLSRMQVVVPFEGLDVSARQTIWSQAFADLRNEDVIGDWDDLESHIDELAEKELNGLQIQNVLTTARQLSKHREEYLHWVHFQQALAVTVILKDSSAVKIEAHVQ